MICVYFDSSVAFKEWRVSKEESGTKLLRFLQQKLGLEYSAKALKRALERNLCLVNDRTEHFGSTLVGVGDQVRFICENVDKFLTTPLIPKILFEDNDFLFIEKPAGISSEDPLLLSALKADGKRPELSLAHRLDKETTGVLAFTQSLRAKEALYQLFKERKVSKSYFAVVDGIPVKMQGRIENYLGKLSIYHGQSLWGSVEKSKGFLAITEWKVIRKGKTHALLNCFPLTGRTHQIRVHLAGIGHSILGDKQYGKNIRSSLRPKRCLLHAAVLAFVHPFTHKLLSIESPLPPDFLDNQK